MEERLCPLDMFEKFYSESFSSRRAFNESRNIRNNEAIVGAEVRLKRGECVCGDPALCRRKFVQKTRLARIRQSYEAHVGDEEQFEMVVGDIARQPLLRLLRCRVDRRAELEISAAAHTPACGENAGSYIFYLLSICSIEIGNACPSRYMNYEILSGATVDKLPAPVLATLRANRLAARVPRERVNIRNTLKIDIASPTAVSSRRSLHEPHLVEGNGAIAPVPCFKP